VTERDGKAHWDKVYGRKGAEDVSWFQPSLALSLKMIDDIELPASASIIDVGGGASSLVDDLLTRGFSDLTVLDLSKVALDIARRRLGDQADSVQWLHGDATELDLATARYDLWHDRAVFHFLTDPQARRRYIDQAYRALKPGGHIIVATFGLHGPERCSGLEVARYDADGLHAEFGAPFHKIRHAEEAHRTPWGTEQEFLYCYCRRSR